MNSSAQKASRKWPYSGIGSAAAAIMVTVVTALMLLCVKTEPAAARRHTQNLWGDLFGENRPRPRLLGEKKPRLRRAAALPPSIPLPKLRPADAPMTEPEKPAAAKPAPAATDKPAEQAMIPLPRPRPADAPVTEPEKPVAKPAPAAIDKPAEQAASPPPPSACRLALTDAIAIAPSIPDIKGPGECGAEDVVRLEAVVLPDKRRVSVKPAAILRCAMASEIAAWIRIDMAPLAMSLGSVISNLDNLDSFECRGRNGIAGAKMSEHGRANALDVHDLRLANGQSISFTDRTVSREVRENVLHSMCKRFTTVLGPGSDGYHEEHIHLDLMERHNNYKICQWNVWDPLPQIAPLLPAERPEEAPPRQLAEKSDAAKPDAAKPDAAKAGASKSDAAKSETTKPDVSETRPPADKPATKKRRQDRRF
jgi:hypothetical protein